MHQKIYTRLMFLGLTFFCSGLAAQETTSFPIEKGEKWYGAAVAEGSKMPFKTGYSLDLNGNTEGNQASPLLLSSKGNIIWSEEPFAFEVFNNNITISKSNDSIVYKKGGSNLQEAYRFATKMYFPANGQLPDTLLFTSPQYNTWIELIYDQNQEDILNYAHSIIDNGFPPGVLMIDDNWAPYYGKFEFRKDRFKDAKSMIAELHELGFKVMLWVCPFISPDTEEARHLISEKLVLMSNEGNQEMAWKDTSTPAIIHWWNGYSAVLDFSNSKAISWYQNQLDNMIKDYGLDGFKFDAGDANYYAGDVVAFKNISSNEHSTLWGDFGLKYSLNEYRAMWKSGGLPLVERLRDKSHTWKDLSNLIPDITTAGLLGYPFVCPDMIGGGEFTSFLPGAELDQDLIVRSAQVHALMPMMQFSVAPWRILDKEHLDAVKKAVELRQKFVPEIMKLVKESALTGEPIVSNLEYYFPKQGFEECHDQFMLGSDILVAPLLDVTGERSVLLPKGKWKYFNGKIFKGNKKVIIDVALNQLPYFVKVQ